LKQQIEDKINHPTATQRLKVGDKELSQDYHSLASYKISSGASIKLLGGLREGVAGAKRSRASSTNPFEGKVHQYVLTADADLFAATLNSTVKHSDETQLDVLALLETVSKEDLLDSLHMFSHGKQTNEVKIKNLAESVPDIMSMQQCIDKLTGSRFLIVKKFSALLWKKKSSETTGKFSIDLMKALLKELLKKKGVEETDMTD